MGGLIKNGCPASNIIGCDANQDTLDYIETALGVRVSLRAETLIENADVIVLSVKPQIMQTVLESLATIPGDAKPLFLSVAAGIPLAAMQDWLGGDQAIVRVMPNTPSLVGAGVSGLCANEHVTSAQKELTDEILAAVGSSIWVEDEHLIDAVTAISGSGPAYFFRVMEAMEQAAVELGLTAEQAAILTRQTAYGAALMVQESGDAPGILRERVTSPGGTTERALNLLNEQGIADIFSRALTGARDRSIELGQQFGSKDT